MSEKRITELNSAEFDAIIETYIERETQDMGEIDAPLFYNALEEIFAAEPIAETIELEGRVVGSQLQLSPKTRQLPGVEIHGNEISVNDIRFIINLAPVKS
jgi:hypothetical protein